MNKAAAIHQFWSGFGLTAYEENTVPEDAVFPYITYQLVTDAFDNDVAMTASLWYRGESWRDVNEKEREISAYIGIGGVIIKRDGGRIWLKKGAPFAQNMGDESDNLIRRKYLNVTAEFLTAD
jgi:hypothetical protein